PGRAEAGRVEEADDSHEHERDPDQSGVALGWARLDHREWLLRAGGICQKAGWWSIWYPIGGQIDRSNVQRLATGSGYTTVSSFGVGVRISQPVAVTTTRSSIRTPKRPGT